MNSLFVLIGLRFDTVVVLPYDPRLLIWLAVVMYVEFASVLVFLQHVPGWSLS